MSAAVRYPAARLALSMAIFGTIGIFTTGAGLDAVTTMFWRCVFASVFMAGWCVLSGALPDRTLTVSGLARAALCGVGNMLSGTAYIAAFATISIGTATIIYHVTPFIVVLLGVAFLKERVTVNQLGWMTAAFIGIGLASGLAGTGGTDNPDWMHGIAWTLVAALLYAAAIILGKGLGAQSADVTTLCQSIVGIAILAPFADFATPVPPTGWGWLAGLGLLHSGIAYMLMFSAFPALSTPVIGVLGFIYPLVALLADWLFYGGPLGLEQIGGLGLVVLGTLGVQLGWRIAPPRKPPQACLAPQPCLAPHPCLAPEVVRQPSP